MMQLFQKWTLVAALILALFPPLASAQGDYTSVTVTGEAVVLDGDRPQARQRALQEAFSAALTQVMGAFLSAESYTRNFQNLERGVYSKTEGYVRRYEVLEESVEDDVLTLKVHVEVATQGLKDDLTALGILLDAMQNPIVSVQGSEQGLSAPRSVQVFRQELVARGFRVSQTTDADSADVIIRLAGTVTNRSDIGGMGIHGALVSLQIQAYWREGNRLIATDAATANGAGPTEMAALEQAYTDAARQLFPRSLDAISARWRSEVHDGRLIKVNAQVSEYRLARLFGNRLGRIFGVKSKSLDKFQGGEADFTVRFGGAASLLAELIDRTEFEGMLVRLLGVTNDAVTVYVAD